MTIRLPLIGIILVAGCTAGDSGSAAPSSAGASATVTPAAEPTDSAPPATESAAPTASQSEEASDPLLSAELVDVRSGASFTLGELASEKPLIVETMAIWCTNCRGQMHEVVAAHDRADFHSVSIDVDPNERADDLAAYADREGFDWRFVLADAELATALRDRFSPAILNPPSMPKLLVIAGEVEMVGLNEQLSADEIAALVGG